MINESNLTSRIGGGSQISPQLRDRIRQIRAKAPKPKPQTPDEFWAELEAEQRADDEYRKKYGLPTREQEERSRLVDATEAREMFGIPPDNLAQMEARGLIHGRDVGRWRLYSTADIEVFLREGQKWNLTITERKLLRPSRALRTKLYSVAEINRFLEETK